MTAPKKNLEMPVLADLVAVVTGASSGIGQAIAISLARHGAAVCAVGRDTHRLCETIKSAQSHSRALPFQADLAEDESINRLEQLLAMEFGRLDILVHCAGVIQHNLMRSARIEDFDLQYAVDLRMPYLLTKSLLPMIKDSRGQIVFINSSLGVNVKRPEVGQYAATQHALKAIADSLREEVNPDGIRVLTVYPGRTATPRQKRLHNEEGALYRPEALLQPEDVASVVIHSLALPRTAEVTDIHIRPMIKT
jgi:NAD(P)-dependent dehydrogenase (short-subunit alcohol dehydrogenase family)